MSLERKDLLFKLHNMISLKIDKYRKFKQNFRYEVSDSKTNVKIYEYPIEKYKYFVLLDKIDKIERKYDIINQNNVMFYDYISHLKSISDKIKEINKNKNKSDLKEEDKIEFENQIVRYEKELKNLKKNGKLKLNLNFLKLGESEIFQNNLTIGSLASGKTVEDFFNGIDNDVSFIRNKGEYYVCLPAPFKIIKKDKVINVEEIAVPIKSMIEYFTFFKLDSKRKSEIKKTKIVKFLEEIFDTCYEINDVNTISEEFSIITPRYVNLDSYNPDNFVNDFENYIPNDKKGAKSVEISPNSNEKTESDTNTPKNENESLEGQNLPNYEHVIKELKSYFLDINHSTINKNFIKNKLIKFIYKHKNDVKIIKNKCYIKNINVFDSEKNINYDLRQTMLDFIILLRIKDKNGNIIDYNNIIIKYLTSENKHLSYLYNDDLMAYQNFLIDASLAIFKKHIFDIKSKKKKFIFLRHLNNLNKIENEVDRANELVNYLYTENMKTLIKLQDIPKILDLENASLKEITPRVVLKKAAYGELHLDNLIKMEQEIKFLPCITNADVYWLLKNLLKGENMRDDNIYPIFNSAISNIRKKSKFEISLKNETKLPIGNQLEIFFFIQDEFIINIIKRVLKANFIKFNGKKVLFDDNEDVINKIRVLELYGIMSKEIGKHKSINKTYVEFLETSLNKIKIIDNKDNFVLHCISNHYEIKLSINEKIENFVKRSDDEIKKIFEELLLIEIYKNKTK